MEYLGTIKMMRKRSGYDGFWHIQASYEAYKVYIVAFLRLSLRALWVIDRFFVALDVDLPFVALDVDLPFVALDVDLPFVALDVDLVVVALGVDLSLVTG